MRAMIGKLIQCEQHKTKYKVKHLDITEIAKCLAEHQEGATLVWLSKKVSCLMWC